VNEYIEIEKDDHNMTGRQTLICTQHSTAQHSTQHTAHSTH